LLATSLAMLVPAAYAMNGGDRATALIFGISALGGAALSSFLIRAQMGSVSTAETRSEFMTIIGGLVFAPALAAVPLKLALPYLTMEAAYFEMMSMFTTTGASVIKAPETIPPSLNLWRMMMGWGGGLYALLFAFSVLAPRNLGGYEMRSVTDSYAAVGRLRALPKWAGGRRHRDAAGDRFVAAFVSVGPVYAALTAALALLLIISGDAPFHAVSAALSLLSTTGAVIDSEGMFAASGILGEVFAAFFIVLAATRHAFLNGKSTSERLHGLASDQETRLLFAVIGAVTMWLFLRHWISALELDQTATSSFFEPFHAIWGAAFTALSFATTTGVASESWDTARIWSGMGNPGLILFGLVIMGGGIASTAGGVKLLRAYALFRHGEREMERLVRPSSISGSGAAKRGLRREGAQIAWVFVMLFLLTLAATMLALSLTGLPFERALAAAISALSTTGPLFQAALGDVSYLSDVTAEGRAVLVIAMLLGRVEVLAVIAMLNPGYWR
ncbi:MAG: potassium transporter TrkG, partial [Pikeienuella sp.]